MLNYRLWMLDYEVKIVGLRRSVGAGLKPCPTDSNVGQPFRVAYDFAMLKHCPTRIM